MKFVNTIVLAILYNALTVFTVQAAIDEREFPSLEEAMEACTQEVANIAASVVGDDTFNSSGCVQNSGLPNTIVAEIRVERLVLQGYFSGVGDRPYCAPFPPYSDTFLLCDNNPVTLHPTAAAVCLITLRRILPVVLNQLLLQLDVRNCSPTRNLDLMME